MAAAPPLTSVPSLSKKYTTSFTRSLSKNKPLKEWENYPVELDGWYLAHRTLDADHDRIKELTAALLAQASAGTPLTAAQVLAFSNYFKSYCGFLHHHHDNEEYVVVPYLKKSKNVTLDPKMSADHTTLLDILEKCEGEALKVGEGDATAAAAVLKEFSDAFNELDALMADHLKEEEEGVLIDLRRACTPEEVLHNVTLPIVTTMSWEDCGHFYGAHSQATFTGFCRQEKIPFFVRWLLKNNIRRYRRKYIVPVEKAITYAKSTISATTAK